MFHRSLLRTGAALCVLAGTFSAAHAASEGLLTCRPHDLNRLAEAIANQDNDALREMLSEPEISFCPEYINTAEAILCAQDSLACIEPSGGGDPGDQPGDDPGDDPGDQPGDDPNDNPNDDPDDRPDDVSPGESPFPGQRPGESLGRETSGPSDDNGGGDGGNGGGGSGGGSTGGGSTGGGTPGTPGRT